MKLHIVFELADDGVERVTLARTSMLKVEIQGVRGSRVEAALNGWLDAYLKGQPPQVVVPLSLPSLTSFHRQVLEQMQQIPFGETRSYGEVAKLVGRPRAARAVGGACNRNPVPLLAPCHRVVGHDGQLVGFRGGRDIKEILLTHENPAHWSDGVHRAAPAALPI